jgi:hypothetical protein
VFERRWLLLLCACVQELVGAPFLECFHPQDSSALAQAMHALLELCTAGTPPPPGRAVTPPLWQVLSLRVCRKVCAGGGGGGRLEGWGADRHTRARWWPLDWHTQD